MKARKIQREFYLRMLFSHQNAIVRAATGRLLTSVVDRVGPDQTLILPKDARDKLLSTGARLLIDGNLDAR